MSIGGGVCYVMGEGYFGVIVLVKNLICYFVINNVMILFKGIILKYMEGEDNFWGW